VPFERLAIHDLKLKAIRLYCARGAISEKTIENTRAASGFVALSRVKAIPGTRTRSIARRSRQSMLGCVRSQNRYDFAAAAQICDHGAISGVLTCSQTTTT